MFWSWILYGVYKCLLTSVLIHFCHCKQLNHQHCLKGSVSSNLYLRLCPSSPSFSSSEGTPAGLGGSPPQHFREFLPSSPVGQGLPSLAWPLSWPWIPADRVWGYGWYALQPFGLVARPLARESIQNRTSLAPQEKCGRNYWSHTGCVTERDQQALTGNPAKDRVPLHSCAASPAGCLKHSRKDSKHHSPRECVESREAGQGGTEVPRHHSILQHRHLPTAVFTMPNMLQASKEKNNLPASKPNELTLKQSTAFHWQHGGVLYVQTITVFSLFRLALYFWVVP